MSNEDQNRLRPQGLGPEILFIGSRGASQSGAGQMLIITACPLTSHCTSCPSGARCHRLEVSPFPPSPTPSLRAGREEELGNGTAGMSEFTRTSYQHPGAGG